MASLKPPTTVVITGASAGLGAALAQAYAAPGRTLALVARDPERLEAIAQSCRGRGATVVTASIDVTDAPALANWIKVFDAKTSIDLVIANAGVYTGHGAQSMETASDIVWMSRINLEGVANLVQPALEGMRPRKRGHIAIIGSLAALQPLADAPGYSATKAGVMAYGEALQEYLIPDGITVSLVYPGHIQTAQVEGHVGALPHIKTPEEAAGIIKRKLDAGKTFIAFPWQLLWLIRAGRALHWRVRALAGKDFRFHIQNPPKGP
jgi:NADP-dependent 3-hydroxy acid dehydrogenase YdfG